MDFWDRVKTTIDKSFDSSRDWFDKARGTAHELGERGVLRVEIMQLESRAEKLTAKLGAVTYEKLVKQGEAHVDAAAEGLKEIIDEITSIEARISEKESALEALKRKEEG